MRIEWKTIGRVAAGLVVAAALAFGASVASAEARAGVLSPCNPLPLNGVCSPNCSASCDAIGDPYAGGICVQVGSTSCCQCQL